MPKRVLVLLALIGTVVSSGYAGPAMEETAETTGLAGQEAAAADPRAQFVGNWELVRRERIDVNGELLPPPDPPAPGAAGEVGYIMYDAAGHMGVVIQPPGRPVRAGDEPTGEEEAVGQLGTYTSYFGTYTVNEAEGYVTHHLQGNVRPPDAANDNQRFYEFSGDQLILMPPSDDSGIRRRIVWQRVPDLPEAELTDTHRRLFGFYRFVRIARTTLRRRVGADRPVGRRLHHLHAVRAHGRAHLAAGSPRLHRRTDPGAGAAGGAELRQLLRPVLRERGGGATWCTTASATSIRDRRAPTRSASTS